MRQRTALPLVAALAVLSAAATLHAQCTPIVRSVSQPAAFPNLVAGPIATDGSRVGLAKSDGTSSTPAIFFQLFDANLNATTGDRQVATSSANGPVAVFFADTPPVVTTQPLGEFGLFYQRLDATLMLQRIDLTGVPISTPIVMPHSWSFNDEFEIVWDSAAHEYAIEHFVTFGPDMGLWLTTVSASGTTIFDVQLSVFLSRPANPAVTALPDGSLAAVWTSSSQASFVSIVKGNSVQSTEITEQQMFSPSIAANSSSILVIYSSPKSGGGTQLRSAQLSAAGAITSADSTYLVGSGVDIAPLSLMWNSALSEWALVYSDAVLGFNVFPGEVHLRRFQSVGGPASDTFLSPDANLNQLNARYPVLFLNGGYVGSIARIISSSQGGQSYLVRICPLLTSFSVDSAVVRPFTTITFRATASGGSAPYSYAWTFGDNDSGVGPVVQHHYSANGTYTVTLTATDAAGATAIYKSKVLITDQVRGRSARH